MAKGTAAKSSSGAAMSKYDVEVEARLKQLEEQVITLSIQLQENLDKDTSADTMFATHKGEQNARWDALNKFMKHQFVVEF
tara:strand:+ start:1163 stop:1405 length:243 start_codon:yes stop_codon:yes gene_type:complete